MISFGENLRRLRNKNNLTQEQVGDYCGVSAKAISRYENDQAEPDIQLMKKFARLFKVDFNVLLGYSGKEVEQEELILRKGESSILELYRLCDKSHKTIIRKILKDFVEIRYTKDMQDTALSFLHEDEI
ncbi:MAG: helix-turn-helix domain-containing protein [Erysipelotrichaceae bacterium]|nr:helix-turn-helix domain-containing protein [Erysipelotrichaceae bacterium]